MERRVLMATDRYANPWLHLPREFNDAADKLSHYRYGTQSFQMSVPLHKYVVLEFDGSYTRDKDRIRIRIRR